MFCQYLLSKIFDILFSFIIFPKIKNIIIMMKKLLTKEIIVCIILLAFADVAHLVERHLAKVEVASSSLVIRSIYAPVAQLDRVSGYEPEGQGFESLPARHKKKYSISYTSFYYVLKKLWDSNPLAEAEHNLKRYFNIKKTSRLTRLFVYYKISIIHSADGRLLYHPQHSCHLQ